MRVVSLARWARSDAIAHGRRCRLNIDPRGRICWVTGQRQGEFVPADGDTGRRVQLPEGVFLSLLTVSADPSASCIEFGPTGRSDVATLEVKGRDGESFLVVCESPSETFRVLSREEAAKR